MEFSLQQTLLDGGDEIFGEAELRLGRGRRQIFAMGKIMFIDQVDNRPLFARIVEEISQSVTGQVELQNVGEMFRFHVEIELFAWFGLIEKMKELLLQIELADLRCCHIEPKCRAMMITFRWRLCPVVELSLAFVVGRELGQNGTINLLVPRSNPISYPYHMIMKLFFFLFALACNDDVNWTEASVKKESRSFLIKWVHSIRANATAMFIYVGRVRERKTNERTKKTVGTAKFSFWKNKSLSATAFSLSLSLLRKIKGDYWQMIINLAALADWEARGKKKKKWMNFTSEFPWNDENIKCIAHDDNYLTDCPQSDQYDTRSYLEKGINTSIFIDTCQ